MLPEVLPDQHNYGSHAADACQHLTDPEGAPVQAVHPQSLDDAPTQTVPCGVAKGNLPVVLSALGQEVQQHEAAKIPHRFVQEGGVVVFRLPGEGIVQTHAEEAVRGGAEGLPVHEVAPAADGLADEKAQQHQIQHGGELDFLEFT